MGRTQPTKALAAAKASGIISTIGLELYELLSPRGGAAGGAIEGKPNLSRLGFVHSKLASEEPMATEIAAATRKAIRVASNQLTTQVRSRDAPGLDYGSAARTLLCLEPGTETWALRDRRARAAKKLGYEVRTLTKTRYPISSKGVSYQPSYELALMDALGRKLLDAEQDYLNAHAIRDLRTTRRRMGAVILSEPQTLLYQAWDALDEIAITLAVVIMGSRPPFPLFRDLDVYLRTVGTILVAWHMAVGMFADDVDLHPLGTRARLDQADSAVLVRTLHQCFPTSAYEAWGETCTVTDDGESLTVKLNGENLSWATLFSEWIGTCGCDLMSLKAEPDCAVHRVLLVTDELKRRVIREWECLHQALSTSPEQFSYAYVRSDEFRRNLSLRIDK